MKIRRAGPQDITAVHNLAKAIPEAPQWTLAQFEDLARSDRAIILVAEEEGRIVGFAAVSTVRLPGEVIAQLESIAVDSRDRGRGIGLQLLRHAVLRVAMESAGQMELEVRSHNHPAVALYRKAGFVEQGSRPGYYADPPDDAVLMALRFPQAPIAR